MTDHNEAMRLAEMLKEGSRQFNDDAAALLLKLAARVAELESHVHTCGPTCSKAGCINRRLTAERDQLRAEVETLRGISDEYNHWVRFHAAGDGDFDDFIVTHCRHAEARTTHKETE